MDNNIKSVIAGLSQDLQEILVSESPLQQRIDFLINELVERTYYSAYADQVEVKPFYDMSREIIRYVVTNPERTTNIDHAAFSRLIINFSDLYYLYGQRVLVSWLRQTRQGIFRRFRRRVSDP